MPLTDTTDVRPLAIPASPAEESFAAADAPRDPARVRVLSVLTIALLACAAVFHGWRKGFVLAPTDALQLVAPWQPGRHDYVARNEQLLDQTVQFVPWTIYAVERMKSAPDRAAQIPLWNPHSHLGAPFLANGQSAVFYPTILLHLTLPPEWSWTIGAALRLFAAGLGAYLLAGHYGLRGLARLLPGVAFMLCGFNVVWLNHPHANVMPLLPWAVLVTELLLARATAWRLFGGALVFALQFLGGHPATCIHLLLTCALVWVVRAAQAFRRDEAGAGALLRSGLALAGVVAFGFALAAAQWLPLLEYAKHSGATLERNVKLATQSFIALDPRYLIGLVFPYANGFPDGVAPFELRRVTRLPNTSELAAGFVGTVPFVLAIVAVVRLRRHPIVRAWAIVALVAALIAIRFPIVDHVVRLIPGLSVAQNARLLGVAALALALLSGYGLRAILAPSPAAPSRLPRRLGYAALVVAGFGLIAALALTLAKSKIIAYGTANAEAAYNATTEHERPLDAVKALVPRVHLELVLTCLRLLIPAAMLALTALVLWRAGRRPRRGHEPAVALVTLAAADLLAFAVPFNPGAPAETYFSHNVAAIQKLHELPPARVAATYRTLIPESATAHGLYDVRGYDALAPARYYKWWKHPGIGDLDPAMQGYPARLDNPEHPAWSLLNLGYVLTAPDHDPPPADKFREVYKGEDARIYQAAAFRPRAWVVPRAEVYDTIDPVLDRVAEFDFNPDEVVLLDRDVAPEAKPLLDERTFANTGTVSTVRKPTIDVGPPRPGDEDRPEVVRLRVTGATGGYLVLADTYFAGWTATIVNEATNTGREVPILPAYGVLRAVPLPAPAAGAAASLRVEFRYRPWSWRIGAFTSMTALCLLFLLAGAAIVNSTRRAQFP